MKIFVKTLSGWETHITVRETDGLDVVRQKVAEVFPEKGISAAQVQLIFQGKVVEVGRLKDIAIQDGGELFVVIMKSQNMELTVLHGERRTTLQVDPSETVEGLMAKLSEKLEVSVSEMNLLFQQKEITGGRLSHYKVCHGAELQLTLRAVQIVIKDFNNRKHPFTVHLSDLVENLKGKIQKEMNIPVSDQRLVFEGKQLENKRTLRSYNIEEHSIIQLLLRLRGG